jgi:hypothetical protein
MIGLLKVGTDMKNDRRIYFERKLIQRVRVWNKQV